LLGIAKGVDRRNGAEHQSKRDAGRSK
jgi:hypothetical protein